MGGWGVRFLFLKLESILKLESKVWGQQEIDNNIIAEGNKEKRNMVG